MADEIIQKLGFDANEAIENLDRLGKAISNASGRISRFGTAMERFNQKSAGSGLLTTASAADKMSESIRRADRNVGRLTTSVELLSRIVYTQLVIKGLRLASNAFVDASSDAGQLQLKLADISNISGKTFSGLSDIGNAVEQLSRGLGTDQLSVAEGLYEAIGNQIGGTKKELIDFNRVAGEFAVGTLTEQNASIKLLSGTLNAYQLDVSRSEEVASKFNKAIEVGALTGRDFSSQIGRVIPQAALLGVSLEEVLAAFSTLTRNGLSASESATRLTGVISGLQKPSEKLSEALTRLNVTSGEGLVRSVGFANALKEIAKQTDGSSAEIAKLFPNVRGLAGELILGSQKAEAFASDLKAIQATSTSLNNERFEFINSTDAKRVERELNALRIEMTKLGTEFLHGTAKAFEFVGGADNITSAAKIAAPAVLSLATATAIYAANSRLAALNGTKLGAVLGKFGSLGLLAGTAFSLGDLIGSKIDDSRFASLRKLEAANQSANDAFVKGEETRLSAARSADTEIVRSALDAARTQIAAFQSSNDALLLDEKRLVSVASEQLNRFVSVREKFARQLEKTAQDSATQIEASQRRVSDLNTNRDQRNFDARLKIVDDPGKLQLLISQVSKLSQKAQRGLASAVTDQDISQALKLFDLAERTGENAQTIGERLGQEGRALSVLNRLTQDRIRAERQLQGLQERRAKLASGEADRQKAINDQLKSATSEVLKNLPTVGLNPADLQARQKALGEALNKLTSAGLSKADFSLSDALGLAKLTRELQANPVALNFDAQASVEKIQEQLTASFERFRTSVNFDVPGLETALGQSLKTPDEIAAAFSKATAEADQLRIAISKVNAERQAATGLQSEIRDLLATTDSATNAASRAGGTFLGIAPTDVERGLTLIREFDTEARRLATSSSVTKDQVGKLFDKVRQLNEIQSGAGLSIFGSGGGFAPDIEALSTVSEKLLKLSQLPTVDPAQETRLKQLESVIGGSASKIEGALTRGAERLESAAARLSNAINPTNFATGGQARGTDTVPAMLSPGEFVVNRRSSQQFYSDLRAINAGQTPAYRSEGGSVTNVGDISISVNESTSPRQTGREVLNLLNREFRRGTSKVRN